VDRNLQQEWLWRIYRQVAEYVHTPDAGRKARINSLLTQYLYLCNQSQQSAGERINRTRDEHEWLMDFC